MLSDLPETGEQPNQSTVEAPSPPVRRGRQHLAAVTLALAALILLAAVLASLALGWPGLNTSRTQALAAAGPELVVLDWAYDIPQAVLDAFGQAHGVNVRRVIYSGPADVQRLFEAAPAYDMAVVAYEHVRPLADAGKLAPLDLRAIPNFRYIDPGFRNLIFDPGNRYSIPSSWAGVGVIGINQAFAESQPSWGELWDTRFSGGKVAIWRQASRHVIAATLKRLGFSANSEDPDELAAARAELLRLRPNVVFFDNWGVPAALAPILQNQFRATIGDTSVYQAGRTMQMPLSFYYPAEGALIWGDAFVVPVTSRNPDLAVELINTLISPSVAAQIMEYKYMRVTNEAAVQSISPDLAADPILFPDLATLRRAELVLPLSPTGQARWDAVWAAFLQAQP